MNTVSAPYLRILVDGARAAGVELDDLLTAELRAVIADPDGRVDRDVNNRLWAEIARRSGDGAFGLHLAERIRPGAFAVMDYVARNAASLRETMLRFRRFCRLIHSGVEVYLEEADDVARLGYTLPGQPGGSTRHAAEFIVGTWLVVARQITGQALVPRCVRFEHARPAEVGEHRRLLGCEPRFREPVNELALDREHLELPLVGADPTLGELLDRYAEELLARLPRSDALTDRVRLALAEGLPEGEASLEAVAGRLRMSPRTLQRRLREAGTSHQQVVDQLRHELAVEYLQAPELSIGEAAFLLGFSEPSAFHRAFKRWTGRTPGEFRREARA